MKKLWWVFLAGIVMLSLAFGYWASNGRTHVVSINVSKYSDDLQDYRIKFDPDKDPSVSLRRATLEDGVLTVTLQSEKVGKSFVEVSCGDENVFMDSFYVHPLKTITQNSVFGPGQGTRALLLATSLFLLLLFIALLFLYRRSVREKPYSYRNIMLLGLLIFLAFVVINQFYDLFTFFSIDRTILRNLEAFQRFAFVALPVAFVLGLLVTGTNLDLLRKEGKSWKNLLGFFLGLLLLLATLLPWLTGEFLQRTTLVNVHNANGPALYIEYMVENTVYVLVAYLECILLGAIVHGFRAARHVPSFDKDYILILGCMIRKDGTLTPLLRGRVDRAIEFARMQKEATGKDIIFVPSGGQGSDEVIAEAEAMYNYLIEQGIPKEQILVENRSKNTYENFTYSKKLIEAHAAVPDPQIAFSTTNYHVFRSGFYAHKQGIKAEGIGSKTKVYYWVNAYIREFIATMRSEWKTHAAILAVLTLAVLLLVAVVYISNNF